MIKTLMKSIKGYGVPSLLSIVFVSLEVVMEVSIPFVMKYLIDEMNTSNIEKIIIYSVILLVMSIFSLFFGALAGKFCARGSTGFARNLRRNIFKNITDFSFSNIDKFSTPSLVTRITTGSNVIHANY